MNSLTMKAVAANGSYTLPTVHIPVIYGQTGIGLKCWDNLDNSSNKCGIYSIEMLVDSVKVYCFTADRFLISANRGTLTAMSTTGLKWLIMSISISCLYNRATGCQCTTAGLTAVR